MEFDFKVEHIEGQHNIVADGLSRHVEDEHIQAIKNSMRAEEVLALISENQQPALLPTRAEQEAKLALDTPPELLGLLNLVHCNSAGHHGVEETIRKAQRRLAWEGKPYPKKLRAHVKQFIRRCPTCQVHDTRHWQTFMKPFTLAGYEPMQCLALDLLDLRPDENGFRWVLVIIDCFTRFTELCPLPDAKAETVARRLIEHIGRYGACSEVVTDNGREFANTILPEVLELIAASQRLTIAYSKEENAIGERVNREIKRHVKNILFDRNFVGQWSDYLPLVQRIINASVHKSIGVSLAQLLFGDAITLDRRIFLPYAERYTNAINSLAKSDT